MYILNQKISLISWTKFGQYSLKRLATMITFITKVFHFFTAQIFRLKLCRKAFLQWKVFFWDSIIFLRQALFFFILSGIFKGPLKKNQGHCGKTSNRTMWNKTLVKFYLHSSASFSFHSCVQHLLELDK